MKKLLLIIILIGIAYVLYSQLENQESKRYKFSVIVLPDTQNYSKSFPSIFCEQTKWIIENKKKLNIVFVSHMGDIVDSGGSDLREWENAANCMKNLNGKVPYGIIPGNHDSDIAGKKESGFKIFNEYFPAQDNNHYVNNENNFQTIEVYSKKILFLNLSIEANDKELEWAQKVLNDNKDKYVILTTHKYLHDYDNKLSQGHEYSKNGNSGQQIWDKLIYKNCNIKMVWSGHYHKESGENLILTKNSCGDDVQQIVQDYQSRENGGNGLLRIYEFDIKNKNIKVKTYSPFTKTYEKDFDSEFELKFIIP